MPAHAAIGEQRQARASSSIADSTFSAITGPCAFSSKLPDGARPRHGGVVPMTCAHTISSISDITGFTLPA
jgi:hypothetical protein